MRAVALVMVVLLMAGVSACTNVLPERPRPVLNFATSEPVRLAVSQVRIKDNYRPPLAAPNIEHAVDFPPKEGLMRWAAEQLQASGGDAIAALVILDASLTDTPLKKTKGLSGVFTNDQAHRYDGTLKAELRIIDPNDQVLGFVTSQVHRSTTAAENFTINQRDALLIQLVEDITRDFDREIRSKVNTHLARFVR